MDTCKEREDFTAQFWEYYRMLENDCVELRRFVSFREENLGVCSDEIIKQLLSVSAEFDGLCKEITKPKKRKPTIVDYGKHFFCDGRDDFRNITIVLRNSNICLAPFSEWGPNPKNIMTWWRAYNLVKHNRSENYLLGDLQNLLNAMAALYFLERYWYKQISLRNSSENYTIFDIPPDRSELFYIENFKTVAFAVGGGLIGVE